MSKQPKLTYLLLILLLVALIIGSTYAYFSFTSNNKRIRFNTAKNLKEYIVYNEGTSSFVGDFKISNSYTEGIHSTISIYKKAEAANVNLVATINMDIKEIGTNISNSSALKWAVTTGNSSSIGQTIARGDFTGATSNSTITLVNNIEVTQTEAFYTIWIWLDASENPNDNLIGETLDTVVWTEINQVEAIANTFEVTRSNINYQHINLTVENSDNLITYYSVTNDNNEPSSWTAIDVDKQSRNYNFRYSTSSTGTYYVWFKDATNQVISYPAVVTNVDLTNPTCTFGPFNNSKVGIGGTIEIVLTCTDTETDIGNSNLDTSEITAANNLLTVTNIIKNRITNGYEYTITATGGTDLGSTSLTVLANSITNGVGLGNNQSSSGNIAVTSPIGVITISQTIQHFEKTNPSTFVYSIDAISNNNNIFSDVASITFNSAGTQTVTIQNIPIPSTVTVTAVYNARWYNFSSATTTNVNLTSASSTQTVSFTADYNYLGTGGGTGINTNYSYNLTNGWVRN